MALSLIEIIARDLVEWAVSLDKELDVEVDSVI